MRVFCCTACVALLGACVALVGGCVALVGDGKNWKLAGKEPLGQP